MEEEKNKTVLNLCLVSAVDDATPMSTHSERW